MKKTVLSISSVLIVIAILTSGCSFGIKNVHAAAEVKPAVQAIAKAAKKTPVAKIIIYEDGTYDLQKMDGKPGKKCKLKPNKVVKTRCRGLDNGKIEKIMAIPVLKTLGSVCYTTYNAYNEAIQVCYPE